jgi:kynurenine 3-monooxygenase
LNTRTAWGSSPEVPKPLPGQEHDDGQAGGKQGGANKDSGKGKRKIVEDEEGTGFDLIVGCDGSWSKVRTEMMRVERFVLTFLRFEES